MPKKEYSEYLKIRQAAAFLGVSPQTLRSWEKTKKLETLRHPKNRYRLYRINSLQKLRENRSKKYHKTGK